MFSIEYKVSLTFDNDGNLKKYKINVSGFPDSLVNEFREKLESYYSSLQDKGETYSDGDVDESSSYAVIDNINVNDINDKYLDNNNKKRVVIYLDDDEDDD